MVTLSDLPLELFLDNILPLLHIRDLLNFSCTSRHFYELASDETFWHGKIEQDFNFTGAETARNTGWKFLYKRFSRPRVYVWGERTHGRLGLTDGNIPDTAIRRDGVPYPVQLRIPHVRIVNIVAGGMSFHALDSDGNMYVWGTLDGLGGALRSEGFSTSSKKADHPMRLSLPVKIRSISCGRLHCAALDASAGVWTFTSWGRPFRLGSPLLDKSTPESMPVQVESGWAFSTVLVESGDVFVWWPFSGRIHEAVAAKNEELDVRPETRALPTDQHPDVIPCCTWELRDIDPVRLPAIPSGDLPCIEGTSLSEEQMSKETKLIKIAGMDNALVGLTNKGHVLRYDMLAGEDTYSRGHWQYLPEFSEVKKVRAHPAFVEGDKKPEPPETMLITHVSAQFHTFFAYSTGTRSVVLMGKPPEGHQFAPQPQAPTPAIHPIILPGLQNRGVISVVLGDYHYGALTSDGKLLTWGAFSKGALGLGDPTTIPLGQPGGFTNEAQQRQAATRLGMLRAPPPEVTLPTEVRFDHGENRRKERYCFAATAAGWHMGALVIDLEPDEEGPAEDSVQDMPGAYPAVHVSPNPPSSIGLQPPGEYPMLPFGRGVRPFRLGFPARGMWRGEGRGRGGS
ncbi:RCC1/BLIP-II [Laetiporus sulphureus 93-53]|uniref:RCC1/BLIP-II n=1 Tax=Laetiporus sulphureus 93-53 TaxID=1314785 RepID=A0A165GD44_9APHY|nr:RCC1/BLIP-II [Laetiporus sulphureus 93-53]KZT10184.1 RCC1/BLIP-II [Laetiporus sulphureus 93-53]